ncbi:MAG: carbamoyl phosphate synthase small subunit [Flavobacteriales bacterium]|nr:carbamoyl phosphate synthase small subunit [Flavobacteriales bacterium]|tara:strand:+ start:274 stop:1395 length:1122 start_codon:yes stop_codon:yes gene_type:complete
MKYLAKKKAVIVLEDGKVFHGKAAGKIGTTTGEICFNTGMTGYQEIFTDPSYYKQIVVMTTSHIGNYGVAENEFESEGMKISGMVCKSFSPYYSRPAGNASIQEYFEGEDMVGISDVDTRALVRYIRDKGAMNAIISSEDLDLESLKQQLAKIPSMAGLELASKVSCTEPYILGDEKAQIKVAVLDLGVKRNILSCLEERGVQMKVFPHNSSYEDLVAWEPDGIFLSNGPGDPAAMQDVQEEVKKIIASEYPVFGICLGHQMICSALGLSTYKMHNGHRGCNHPVRNEETTKCEVTSQNHGFVVKMDDAKANDNIVVTHLHLNDNTLAGIRIKDKAIFSVQFHPEASPGPHDSRYLFDTFVKNIQKVKETQTV